MENWTLLFVQTYVDAFIFIGVYGIEKKQSSEYLKPISNA